MNDRQFEAVLRSALVQHAATVNSGPTWPLDDELLDRSTGRRHRAAWWPIAAAVAAVLAVLGLVLAVRHNASDRHRPATPVTVTRTACTIDPSPAWSAATNAATLKLGDTPSVILGGAPDGTVLLRYGFGKTSHTELIAPDGSRRTLDERPELAGGFTAKGAEIDRRWIVLPVWPNTPDSPTTPPLAEFDVIDRATLHRTEAIQLTANDKVNAWAMLDGQLYWVDGHGRVADHDLATRQTRNVVPSGALSLNSSLTGVAWSDAQGITHQLAGAPVDQVPGLPGRHPDLVTDGTAYAWVGNGDLVWYSAATRQTVLIHDFAPGIKVSVRAVGGPYVVVEDNALGPNLWIADTRTGALMDSDTGDPIVSAAGILAFSGLQTVIAHVDRLPELSC